LTPESTEVCEKNPQKKQWYSLRRFDPDDQRRNPALSLGQLTEIYRHYGPLIRPVADDLNNLIDSVQRETGILDSNTAVAGFSQGAMLACFTALTRRGFDGKCLMFAGVVAGADELEKEVRSAPKTYLFHGQDDTSVNFKTMEFSKNWLTDHLIETKAQSYAELAHRMREDELADAVKILKGA
jgi:phospholipase/carboxylesterase